MNNKVKDKGVMGDSFIFKCGPNLANCDDLGYTCLFKAQALQTNLIKNKNQCRSY